MKYSEVQILSMKKTMEMMLSLILLPIFCWSKSHTLTGLLLLFSLSCLSLSPWGLAGEELVFSCFTSPLSTNLIILTIFITFLMVLASHSLLKIPTYLFTLHFMLFILLATFKVSSLISFYFMFETALLPIFLLILGWGYQPERLSASLNLFLYTVAASLPLLMMFLTLTYFWGAETFLDTLKANITAASSFTVLSFLLVSLLASFMVKYPLFLVHLWLPKAHVEAPVAGSMMLAAILLKLGGYGLLRLLPLISSASVSLGVSMFSLVGGGLISALCLRQTDIKVLIAYSSVAHMSLAISASLTFSVWGLWGAFLMMLAHGLASSGLFSAANFSYERIKTRNALLTKSLLTYVPYFSLGWFLLSMANMGAPPSLNLLSEILSLLTLLGLDLLMLLPLAFTLMLAVAFTLLLYASTQQPQPSLSKFKTTPLSARELLIFFLHIAPVFFLPILTCNLIYPYISSLDFY